MKLSKVTVEILKNFANINQGIIFKPRSQLIYNECYEIYICNGYNT